MYVGKIKGKKIRFTNKDYKSLKEKWSPKNVIGYSGGSKIQGKCTLCKATVPASPKCESCPLGIFIIHRGRGEITGCYVILNHYLKGQFGRYFLSWDYTDGVKLRTKVETTQRYMQKIQDVLGMFKKENGGNESSG